MNDSASKCDAVVIQRGAGARRALKARPMEGGCESFEKNRIKRVNLEDRVV